MNFLLDTNVVSEWTRPQPNPGLIGWLEEADEDRLFLSVITLAELRYGTERLAAGKKRARLEEWLDHELPQRFEDRVLAIDPATADACGKITAQRERLGHPLSAMDAFLASTAEVHGLTLITRNVSDFQGTVRSILNPWTEE